MNEKVCNEEALSRWIDPERGFLSPAEFIPALEESGQIYKLDLYVAEKCSEPDGRTFYDEELPDGRIVHYFARWIARNPSTGDIAIAVTVLSISEPS